MRLTLAAVMQRISRIKGELAALESLVVAARCTTRTTSTNGQVDVVTSAPGRTYESIETERQNLLRELLRLETSRAVANGTVRVTWRDTQLYLVSLVTKAQQLRSEISRLTNHVAWGGEQIEQKTIRFTGTDTSVQFVDITTWHIVKQDVRDRIKVLQAEFDELNDLLNQTNHTTILTIE